MWALLLQYLCYSNPPPHLTLPKKESSTTLNFTFFFKHQAKLTIMRHGALYPPPPLLTPSPSPTPILNAAVTVGDHDQHPILVSVLLALFLPCAGISAVFVVYICLLWYASNFRTDNQSGSPLPIKQVGEKGLSVSELEMLPKVTGKELVLGIDCAVCLDEVEIEQPIRMIPGCNHGFHLECADTWLSKHPVCPVCRAKLEPKLFDPSHDNS
ncbi:hypothetical protein F3Y22_tig00110163pilonHSYRG00218 [Hibiscus syriacus]|uniref:RING-type E3 ubiquitin transferase n=1 Tax=Hibiscus syriacus TaxID=106335 RepID=A0A6A3BKG3_HIBSY|nr:E3 ubiquitin-protein ligase ATL23-like [Hibiscus syriacus]KAE8715572.1 hypothetical protein F3Y22_tig00110163pilonHSYRG00218 [Hibiscus syriacus]